MYARLKVKSENGAAEAALIGFKHNKNTFDEEHVISYDSGKKYEGFPECEMHYMKNNDIVVFVWHPYDSKTSKMMSLEDIENYLVQLRISFKTRVAKYKFYRGFIENFFTVEEFKKMKEAK